MVEGPAAVPVRDAATVMLVRDAPAGGIEVFMLRRNLDSDFVGGAYVFPGGAVDPEDHDDLGPWRAGRDDAAASATLGVRAGGLAYWVAAVRECFEEAGVLLAYDRSGSMVRVEDPEARARFDAHRRAVDRGQRRLGQVCEAEGLVLALDGMSYFSRWITPVGPPRRYDTRFFVAAAPEGQVPLHDDRETIESLWITPAEALDRNAAGGFELILPTMRSLVAIDRFATAAELLDHAAAIDEVPPILPRIVSDEGGLRIVLPGDPAYDDVRHHVLPGGAPAQPPDQPVPALVPGDAE